MKLQLFTVPTTVITVIGLHISGIISPCKASAMHDGHGAPDNTKDDAHQEEIPISQEEHLHKEQVGMFLPGAPEAALNDHQRRYNVYSMNRKLDASCEDSPLKVLTGKAPPKACAFIAKKPDERCKGRKVKSHCPDACGECAKFGTADSEGTFDFEGARTSCARLRNLASSHLAAVSYWCQFDSLRATCRETCGFFCADEPEECSAEKITSIINAKFGDVVKGPPQEQALSWLIEDITDDECDNEAMIIQRYILAIFYYSTGGDDWYYDDLGWLDSTSSECDWGGLTCNDNQQVRVLQLYAFGESSRGTIPTELSALSNLEILRISENKVLEGTLPESLRDLTKLQEMTILYSDIGGTIPDMSRMVNLEIIRLSHNSFTGPTVGKFSNLQKLEYLEIIDNGLDGGLDPELFQLPKLGKLYLNENSLTGTIPDNFGGNTSLKTIGLSNNLLTGTIPDVTGDSFQSIEKLYLGSNKMSGPVPDSICDLRESKPNKFNWLSADCAPPDSAQNPCPSGCCTKCYVGKGLS